MNTVQLLFATVGHERFFPKKNKFLYYVYYVAMPVTNVSVRTPFLFSFNRWNVLSVYTRDHGAKTSTEDWRTWIESQCAKNGMTLSPDDEVLLIAHPRLFGYAFNPISYWLIYEKSEYLKAVLCEVRNTFGDNHNYFLAHKAFAAIEPANIFSAKKNLYVSPFNTIEPGSYTFTFTSTGARFASVINYFENGMHLLNTYMGGTYTPLTSYAIAAVVIRYPFMTLMVIFRIHFQALILRIKGVSPTLHTRPPHTEGKTTRGSTTS